MLDDETDDAQADNAPSLRFVALSLRDGLDAERNYHQNAVLDRGNSTFWQRCRAEITRNGFHHVTAYNLWQEVSGLFREYEPDKRNLERFLRALRTGQIDAIGHLPPRLTESLPVLIPAHAWDQCQIGWETGELTGAALHFLDVRILISTINFERFELFYSHQHVRELAVFPPSEDKRKSLGIAAGTVQIDSAASSEATAAVDITPDRKTGRPSFKDDIIAAFGVIEKDVNWTDKALAAVIRQHVRDAIAKQDDKGLGDDAIIKHVRPLWQEFKNRPS